MSVPFEHFELFFRPLVGSEDARQQLQAELVAGIEVQTPVTVNDRYVAMRAAANRLVETTVTFEQERYIGPQADENDDRIARQWEKLKLNAQFGTSRTIDALQAVGNQYQFNALGVPQLRANVQRNVNWAIGNTAFIAGQGANTAMRNLTASHYGQNPRGIMAGIRSLWHAGMHHLTGQDLPPSFAKAFHMDADPQTGQLSLKLRHRWQQEADRRFRGCPAAQLELGPASDRQEALLLYMRSLGDVAISSVYPHQFVIAE